MLSRRKILEKKRALWGFSVHFLQVGMKSRRGSVCEKNSAWPAVRNEVRVAAVGWPVLECPGWATGLTKCGNDTSVAPGKWPAAPDPPWTTLLSTAPQPSLQRVSSRLYTGPLSPVPMSQPCLLSLVGPHVTKSFECNSWQNY